MRCWDKDPTKRPYFPEIVERLSEIIVEAAVRDKVGFQFWMQHGSKKVLRYPPSLPIILCCSRSVFFFCFLFRVL
jgi:hypothetical protein